MPNHANTIKQTPREQIIQQLQALLMGSDIRMLDFLKYRCQHSQAISNNEVLDLLVDNAETIDTWNVKKLLLLTEQIPKQVYDEHKRYQAMLYQAIQDGSPNATILYFAYAQFLVADINYEPNNTIDLEQFISNLNKDPENVLFDYFKTMFLYLRDKGKTTVTEHLATIKTFFNSEKAISDLAKVYYSIFRGSSIEEVDDINGHVECGCCYLEKNRHPLALIIRAEMACNFNSKIGCLKNAADCGSIEGLHRYAKHLIENQPDKDKTISLLKTAANFGSEDARNELFHLFLHDSEYKDKRTEAFEYLSDLLKKDIVMAIFKASEFASSFPTDWLDHAFQELLCTVIVDMQQLKNFDAFTYEQLHKLAQCFICLFEIAKSYSQKDISNYTYEILQRLYVAIKENKSNHISALKDEVSQFTQIWLCYHFSESSDDKKNYFNALKAHAIDNKDYHAYYFLGAIYLRQGNVHNALLCFSYSLNSHVAVGKGALLKNIADSVIGNCKLDIPEKTINALLKIICKQKNNMRAKLVFYIFAYCKMKSISDGINFEEMLTYIRNTNNHHEYTSAELAEILSALYSYDEMAFQSWLSINKTKIFLAKVFPVYLSVSANDSNKLKLFYEAMKVKLNERIIKDLEVYSLADKLGIVIKDNHFFFYCIVRFPRLIPLLIEQGYFPREIETKTEREFIDEAVSLYQFIAFYYKTKININESLKAIFHSGLALSEKDKVVILSKKNKKKLDQDTIHLMEAIILADFISNKIPLAKGNIRIVEHDGNYVLHCNYVDATLKAKLPIGAHVENDNLILDPCLVKPENKFIKTIQPLFKEKTESKMDVPKKKRKRKKSQKENVQQLLNVALSKTVHSTLKSESTFEIPKIIITKYEPPPDDRIYTQYDPVVEAFKKKIGWVCAEDLTENGVFGRLKKNEENNNAQQQEPCFRSTKSSR